MAGNPHSDPLPPTSAGKTWQLVPNNVLQTCLGERIHFLTERTGFANGWRTGIAQKVNMLNGHLMLVCISDDRRKPGGYRASEIKRFYVEADGGEHVVLALGNSGTAAVSAAGPAEAVSYDISTPVRTKPRVPEARQNATYKKWYTDDIPASGWAKLGITPEPPPGSVYQIIVTRPQDPDTFIGRCTTEEDEFAVVDHLHPAYAPMLIERLRTLVYAATRRIEAMCHGSVVV